MKADDGGGSTGGPNETFALFDTGCERARGSFSVTDVEVVRAPTQCTATLLPGIGVSVISIS